ncbi:MAG TPA: right-handed parallel beta-helix repeat-containing protein, partial [Candidatus Limnocylindrales bacterium]|nr:right-handed parallel beta-helix repeat-containing protein [Candidatus Limnocylindrales bacterium]
ITAYDWTFGTDGTGSGVTTNHTFSADGDYDVTLTVTDNLGATNATTQTVSVSSGPPPSGGTYVVSRSGNTYQAASAGQTFTGTLKAVVESAVADLNGTGGGTVSFTAGDFDLGSDWFHFQVELVNITFEGQGIDVTVIRNYTTVDSDTEPFNFRGTDGVIIRDLTVSAGGTFRNTSDAIDFDRGNNSLVERVKITASRAKGIIFDGKNVDSDGTPWHSQNNVVRDCEISGTNNDGIQFLASSNNRVENCNIHDVGQDGIDVRKSQSSAQQPNKKSNDNVLIGNTITNAGENGIRITSSDGNQLIGNTIADSSSQASDLDGIRIESTDGITCDDNVVDANSATDTRTPKLQAYGLNIYEAECNRTVVGSNNFAGNRDGDIRDRGTDTLYQPTDTEPPSVPTDLSAVAPESFQVDLSWTAATDNIGVTGYEIVRDGSQIDSVGPVTSYQDFTVAASTAYAYQVRALDGAGNQSALSSAAQVTTPPPAGNACTDSSPNSGGYTVTVCITSPASGASLVGDTQVTATVSVNGSSPGLRKMIFWLGSDYLLTDYQAPFTFTLETTRWADGQRTLLAEAHMRDGFVSDPGAVSTLFANGISQPPPNTGQWTPTQGTAPALGQPFVFAAVGDGADGSINAGRVTDLIASWNPNMFSYVGDVYERGTATEFTNWYGIDTNYGRFRSITNPVIGNHENLDPNSAGYFDYWDNAPNYYSVDAAGWHLLFIDSTGTFGQTSPSSQQYQWIAADLAANQSPCTMAIYHHPAYTIAPSYNSGDPGRVQPIWTLLANNGVDVVINGHDHDYQRWMPMDGSGTVTPGGTTEFVVGTGGHGIQGFVRSDSRVAAGFDTSPAAFGALRMELNSAGAAYQFIDVDGIVLDSGSLQCAGSADTEPPSVPTNLVASATSSAAVDLSWTGSIDNIGVTAYD